MEFVSLYLKGRLTFFPITGAKFIGLQSIQSANDFFHIPADTQIIDAHPTDNSVRINDVSCPQRDFFSGMQDSQRIAKLFCFISKHGESEMFQIGMVVSPSQMNKLAVGTDS